jgi:hypothetical protein
MSGAVEDCLDCLSSTVQMNAWLECCFSKEHCEDFLRRGLDDDSLREFGENLEIPTDQLENHAKPLLRKILNAIHDESGIPIDRFCVSCSVGHQPDNWTDCFGFDITAFVDCSASHPTEGELEHRQCTMDSSDRVYGILRGMVSSSSLFSDHRGLHFEMDGYHFHIAVTPSLGHKMHQQRKAVWDLVEERDKEGTMSVTELETFSVALHESLTSFMHMGDPVYHGLVRLARIWRVNNLFPAGAEDLSALAVSLVMIRSIEEEKARGMSVASPTSRSTGRPFPVQSVLKQFLTVISELPHVVMTWHRFYEPDLIPERHLTVTPCYILDPVNPWRNVIANIPQKNLVRIAGVGREGLKVLNTEGAKIKDLFAPKRQEEVRGG